MEREESSRGMSEVGPCVGDEGCSWAREAEDSLGPEVRALFRGGSLLNGCEGGGDGGVGTTLISYLRWIRVVGAGATGMSAATTTGSARQTMVAAAWATASRSAAATGAGKEGRTRGL